MSGKRIAIASGAIGLLIAAVAVTAFVWSRPSSAVRFAPAVGDSHQYRIGLRVGVAPGESVFDRAVILQSVVRYRVTDRDHDATTLRVEPRYMVGKMGHRVLFDSTRTDHSAREPIAAAMRAGFDLTIGHDGHTQLTPANRDAWEAVMQHSAIQRLDQFKQQLNAPGVLTQLPARAGATRTAGGFQTLPKLKLTVTKVSPEAIVVAIDRAEDTQPVQVPLGDDDAPVTMTLDHLHGKMRIARDSGWIESLALVADQTGTQGSRSVPIHLDLSMQALPEDPAAGDLQNSLAGFERVAQLAGDEDDDSFDYPLHLPQSDDDTHDPQHSNAAPDPLFAESGATFKVDSDQHELVLEAPYNIEDKQSPGHVTLAGLTLTGADGQALDLPMVVDEMRFTLVDDRIGTHISLRPLGWGSADLSAIHGVQARFTYRSTGPRQHTGIELADHPTELRKKDAVARAIPIEGQSNQWRIEVTNDQGNFFVDRTQSYAGLKVFNTNRRYGAPLAPVEAGLIARVAHPMAEHAQFRVEGQAQRLPLAYTRFGDDSRAMQVVFTDQALRYRDRSAPPPDTHHIFGLDAAPEQALDLDGLAPRDADLNRLRLRLPAGLGQACELKAKAPAENGHALVWQPRKDVRRPLSRDDDEPANAGLRDWELATDDGVRRYFYDIAVDTTLHCPGQPQWQRADHQQGDTPWLVDIADVLGHPVDADTPATAFFERLRFLDNNGKPLRPMRLDAKPNDRLDTWHDEAKQSTLGDYLADDGTVRFWGRVATIQQIGFSGQPIDKHWHNELGDYQ
ncbi:hypothetical protein V5738_18160 [Salinisphaera sp. SPP-AMP-43]|uniref:hypothetical protein n=1 Tax=Salinisphaera sp. SPP-AMP-43 TaxID=3121288 RepID=UPI003C6E46B3